MRDNVNEHRTGSHSGLVTNEISSTVSMSVTVMLAFLLNEQR